MAPSLHKGAGGLQHPQHVIYPVTILRIIYSSGLDKVSPRVMNGYAM